MQNNLRVTVVGALAVCFVLVGVLTGHSTTVEKMNVARLIEHSELILVGQVVGMTDGFDGNNLPYTDITLQVAETIKGAAGGSYTFRQFGLMAPRDMGDGRTMTKKVFWYNYSQPGTYTVTLKVKDNEGAWSDPVTREVTVPSR